MSSYSALLRRSKLASYNPSIEQVYTTTSANLSRSSWGLKRSLPASTTSRAPFVRVNKLDNTQKRTEFRKATREVKFVKKWQETGIRLKTGGPYTQQSDGLNAVAPQSYAVPAGYPGEILPLVQFGKKGTVGQVPNVLSMRDEEFERLLLRLGERREEFRNFLQKDAESTRSSGKDHVEGLRLSSDDQVDLYHHAQGDASNLTLLLQRFLTKIHPVAPTDFKPFPAPEPRLALAYSNPTPLESSLAAPIPGRLLAPDPNRSQTLIKTSLLGQITPVDLRSTYDKPNTIFFPDEGTPPTRSNIPGRALFELSPVIDVLPTVNALAHRARRNSQLFGARRVPGYVPLALHMRLLDLQATVLDPRHSTPRAEGAAAGGGGGGKNPVPGSPDYCGTPFSDIAAGRNSGALAAMQALFKDQGLQQARDLSQPPRDKKEAYDKRKAAEALKLQRMADQSGSAGGRRTGSAGRQAKSTAHLANLFRLLDAPEGQDS